MPEAKVGEGICFFILQSRYPPRPKGRQAKRKLERQLNQAETERGLRRSQVVDPNVTSPALENPCRPTARTRGP